MKLKTNLPLKSIALRPPAERTHGVTNSPKFSGILDEIHKDYVELAEIHQAEQANSKEEEEYQTKLKQLNITKELMSKKVMTINNREFNGLETLQLFSEMSKANKSWNRRYIPLIWNSVALVPTVLAGIFLSPLAFVIGPAAVTSLVMAFDSDLYYGNIRSNHLSALAHQKTPLPDDQAMRLLDEFTQAGLLEKSTARDSEGRFKYYYFNLTPLAKKVIQEHELIAPAPPIKRSIPMHEAGQAKQKRDLALSIIHHPQARLKIIKLLISPNPIDGQTGFQQLEKITQRYDKRFPLGRFFKKGLPQAEVGALFPGQELAMIHRQLESMRQNGLIEKTEKSGKIYWQPTDRARSILKQGDPKVQGNVSDADLKDILQLEIDELESSKTEKIEQFKELELQNKQLLTDLSQLTSEIAQIETKLPVLLEQIDAQPAVNSEEQKQLRQEIRQQTIQLKRLQSLKNLKTELSQRVKSELEAKQMLLTKRLDQIEQSITTLMESQVKLSVVQAEQGIQDVMNQLQENERQQLAGEQHFGEQTQWITQQIHQSFDSPEAKQQLNDALLAIKTEQAVDQTLDQDTLNAMATTLKTRKQTHP